MRLALIFIGFSLGIGAFSVGQTVEQNREVYTISGIVLNTLNSEPVRSATIIVKPENGSQESLLAATTGPSGRFSILGLSAARYLGGKIRVRYAIPRRAARFFKVSLN